MDFLSSFLPLVVVSPVLDYSICYASLSTVIPYLKYTPLTGFVFDGLLLVLALIPTVKESISMYKATKQWQPNRYMALIVREGVAYIFLYVPLGIISLFICPPHYSVQTRRLNIVPFSS